MPRTHCPVPVCDHVDNWVIFLLTAKESSNSIANGDVNSVSMSFSIIVQ